MALARCHLVLQDEEGNIVDGASVEVRLESDGSLPSLFSDRDGLVSIGNPFTAASGLDAGFHVAGGAYRITATVGSTQLGIIRYVANGLSAESDSPQLSTDASRGIGYGTGVGGTVTQGSSKSTSVTLDKLTGTITMHNAALNAGVSVSFTLTNNKIAATDLITVNIKSGATANSYQTQVGAVTAGSCVIQVRNFTAGNLSEAVVLSFAVIKGVAA